MPELPDLQVFAGNLQKALKGKKLTAVEVSSGKKIRMSEAELNKRFKGKTLKQVYREGKQLYFDFGKDALFSMHLMLHGKLLLQPDKDPLPKHTVVAFAFGDQQLVLTDFQKMAHITVDPGPQEGMDALSEELDARWLQERLSGSRSAIKSLLMDQKTIAGIGNAYADEILYEAGIAPQSKSNKIPEAAVRKLAHAIPKVLKAAEKEVRKAHPDIISGEFRDFLSVHNSRKEKSPGGAAIKMEKIGGRSTYYTDEQEVYT